MYQSLQAAFNPLLGLEDFIESSFCNNARAILLTMLKLEAELSVFLYGEIFFKHYVTHPA